MRSGQLRVGRELEFFRTAVERGCSHLKSVGHMLLLGVRHHRVWREVAISVLHSCFQPPLACMARHPRLLRHLALPWREPDWPEAREVVLSLPQGRAEAAPPLLAILAQDTTATGDPSPPSGTPAGPGLVSANLSSAVLADLPFHVISWSVQNKSDLQFLDPEASALSDMLLLQEVEEGFSAEPHLMVHHPSPTGHLCTSVVVHRRHAGLIEEWGENCVPWVRLRIGQVAVTFVSAYLPYPSRAGYAVVVRRNLDDHRELASIQPRAGHLVVAGDYNLAQWMYAHTPPRHGEDVRLTHE